MFEWGASTFKIMGRTNVAKILIFKEIHYIFFKFMQSWAANLKCLFSCRPLTQDWSVFIDSLLVRSFFLSIYILVRTSALKQIWQKHTAKLNRQLNYCSIVSIFKHQNTVNSSFFFFGFFAVLWNKDSRGSLTEFTEKKKHNFGTVVNRKAVLCVKIGIEKIYW